MVSPSHSSDDSSDVDDTFVLDYTNDIALNMHKLPRLGGAGGLARHLGVDTMVVEKGISDYFDNEKKTRSHDIRELIKLQIQNNDVGENKDAARQHNSLIIEHDLFKALEFMSLTTPADVTPKFQTCYIKLFIAFKKWLGFDEDVFADEISGPTQPTNKLQNHEEKSDAPKSTPTH